MEIKVGDYVRTEWGIRQVKKITIEPEVDIGIAIMLEVTALWTSESEYFEAKDIYKHSKNIIDLIEEGDYVNGEKVDKILQVSHKHNSIIINNEEELLEQDIKSIVTHQSFKQVEYEV